MSGFDFPIRRVGGGRKSGPEKGGQTDLASKSNEKRECDFSAV